MTRNHEFEIETFIEWHPILQNLRANASFRESRGYQGFPEHLRTCHLTAGPLTGPERISIPPFVFTNDNEGSLVSIFHFGRDVSGYPGIVHGGLLATMLDEGLGWCCFSALPNNVGVTVTLSVDYVAPMQTDSYGILRAQTVRVSGRKAWVEGYIETLAHDEKPVVVAKAKALFVSPKSKSLLN